MSDQYTRAFAERMAAIGPTVPPAGGGWRPATSFVTHRLTGDPIDEGDGPDWTDLLADGYYPDDTQEDQA